MSSASDDVEVLLEAARRPVERCRLPPAPLRVRLGTAPWLRRIVPTRVAVDRAEAHGRALWCQNPREQARARAAMAAVVAGTDRAHEIEALARRHVIEARVKETLFWQPWREPQLDLASRCALDQALRCGRGVVLSACHAGHYNLGVTAVAATGRVVHSAMAWALEEQPPPGYWGRRVAHRRAHASERGERLFRAAGSFEVVRRLLGEGEIVSLLFSMPGSCDTWFLGKSVMLASGSSRLAFAADAVVLPIRVRREHHRMHLDVAAALDPRAFGGIEELHDALAGVHERWILEDPAVLDDPNRPGAWERGAGPQGWRAGNSRAEELPSTPRLHSVRA
jgi:lauroyl/myristoyl acyltransferase